jgi:FAD/FMN-containing dehydrogenase
MYHSSPSYCIVIYQRNATMMQTISVVALVALEEATHSAAETPHSHSNISSFLLANGVTNFSLPGSPSYTPLLDASIRNLRFEQPGVGKPAAVILPSSKLQLQRSILCARAAKLAIRARGGGHSYAGLSYTAENGVPFAVLDLSLLNRVRVDSTRGTAWAEGGATVGELYAAVGRAGRALAVPAGTCSTVGIGGQVAGGGFGLLARKHGLAADNVVDLVLVDAGGNALTRDAMDEDVFWAVRGGGGGSWGVVYAWKLRLVPVPANVTVFTLARTGPVELVAGLVHKWQLVAPHLPDEFYLSIYLTTGSSDNGNLSMSFTGQVLAPKLHALSVLTRRFPELGLADSDLSSTSWLESTAKFAYLDSVAELTDRQPGVGQYSKSKSDYVTAPISMPDMIKVVRYLSAGPRQGFLILDPYGGAMARVPSAATPFPHRAGYLYSVQYSVPWTAAEQHRADEFIRWIRELYAFMAPFVSKDPRAAYVNYLDLDLGTDGWTNATGGASSDIVSRAAASWGKNYFSGNFERLVRAKTKFDPGNVFNNAQSIPPLTEKRTNPNE